jgi:hypothetical protein
MKKDTNAEHLSSVMRHIMSDIVKPFHASINNRQLEREFMFWTQDVEKVIMMNDYGIRKIFQMFSAPHKTAPTSSYSTSGDSGGVQPDYINLDDLRSILTQC